jgi:NOL1/NOP2/fmu family ribosome biogenesis protein
VVTNNDPRDFQQLPGFFDVVVIDAPCSGSGLFRRDSNAISEWSEANVELCSQRQQRILADAWACLKEDGVLIYSTCSYSAAEDEAIADWLLQEFLIESIPLQIKQEWNIAETISSKGAYGYRFWPNKVKGEGFFIAAFRKKDTTSSFRLQLKKALVPSKAEETIARNWLDSQAEVAIVWQGQYLAAIPNRWSTEIQYLMQQFKVRYAGTELGTIAKKDLLPEHALAVSTICSPAIPVIDVTETDALQYLRKKEFQMDTDKKGWTLVSYQQHPLGWVKLLSNRLNNYYPKEYRILME